MNKSHGLWFKVFLLFTLLIFMTHVVKYPVENSKFYYETELDIVNINGGTDNSYRESFVKENVKTSVETTSELLESALPTDSL